MIAVRELSPGPRGGASSTGAAPVPVLLVGPSLGSRVDHLWQQCVPALSEHARVLGWDLPGHGAAEPSDRAWTLDDLAADLAARVTELVAGPDGTLPPVVAAGVSIGGAVSLTLATAEHAARLPLAAVAGLCTSPRFGTPEAWHERAALVRAQGTAALREGSRERWFATATRETRPDLVEAALADLEAVDDASYARACEALAGHDLSARLAGTTCPSLALGGAEDAVCTPAVIRQIAESTGGEAVVLDDVAHLAPLEAPEATTRHLLALLQRAVPPTPDTPGDR